MRVSISLAVVLGLAAPVVAQQKQKPSVDATLPLPLPAAEPPKKAQPVAEPPKKTQPAVPDVLPLPDVAPPLDLSIFLKDTSLCISPFVKETSGAAGDPAYLESIQKTFFDVAKDSTMLKDAVLLPQAIKCDPRDAKCYTNAGKAARCQNVLVGASAAKGNGVVLSVRIFDVAKQKVVPGSEVEQVLESEKPAEVQAWAEGQACRALSVKCVGMLRLDADRRDMLVYIDNRVAPRTFRTPELIGVTPGVHAVRVAVGQRTSLEKKVVVRRGGMSEMVYARQTESGGLPLLLSSELRGPVPGPSVEVRQDSSWQKKTGIGLLAAAVVVGAFGGYEELHGKSLVNSANTAADAHGGAMFQADVANFNSGGSAMKTGNVLLGVAGALAIGGAILTLAF